MSTDLARSSEYARAKHAHDEARKLVVQGTTFLIAAPVIAIASFVLGYVVLGLLVVGCAFSAFVGTSGIGMLAAGLVKSRTARKKLAALDREPIPEARLLR